MIKSLAVALTILIVGLGCLSQAQLTSTGGGHKAGGAASYLGPGDIISGWQGWWGLRCFSSTYAGNVARLKSPSDVLTSTITCSTGGILGVTGTAIATTCAVSCTIDILYDQSGAVGSYDLINTTEARRPVYLQTGFSPKPAISVSFSTNVWLQTGGGTANITQPWSMAVFLIRPAPDGACCYGVLVASDIGLRYAGADNLFGNAGGGGLSIAGGVTDNVKHSVQMVANGASGKSAVDGTVTASQDYGSNAFPGGSFATTFGNIDSLDNSFTGSVAEFGNKSGAFADAEMTALSAQQFSYWGH